MKQANINIDMDTLYEDLITPVSNSERDKLIKLSYDKILPIMIDFFNENKTKATFVVVGRDAKIVPKHVKTIADNGHEIANHTLSHKRYFSRISKSELENEIKKCNEIIEKITGFKCRGFRSPCYTTNTRIFKVLSENGFEYDMSVNNSFIYQMIKRSYRLLLKNKEYIPHNQELSVIRAPKYPYRTSFSEIWKRGNNDLFEFPISNSKMFSIPFITQLHFNLGKSFSNFIIGDYFNNKYLSINAHFMEFMNPEDFKNIDLNKFVMTPKLAKMDYRMDYFTNVVKKLKEKDFIFKRMDKIIEKLATKCFS